MGEHQDDSGAEQGLWVLCGQRVARGWVQVILGNYVVDPEPNKMDIEFTWCVGIGPLE